VKKFLILIALFLSAIFSSAANSQLMPTTELDNTSQSLGKLNTEWFSKWSDEDRFYSVETRDGFKVYHISDRNTPVPGMTGNWQNGISGS